MTPGGRGMRLGLRQARPNRRPPCQMFSKHRTRASTPTRLLIPVLLVLLIGALQSASDVHVTRRAGLCLRGVM